MVETQRYECPRCATQWVIELAFTKTPSTADKACPRCGEQGKLKGASNYGVCGNR